MGMNWFRETSVYTFLAAVKAKLIIWLTLILDNFHLNTETIKAGNFLRVMRAELQLVAYGTVKTPTKTVGDVAKLIKVGALPLTTMLVGTLLVILLLSTSVVSRAVRLFSAHNDLNTPTRSKRINGEEEEEEEEEKIVLRDFTIEQLRGFAGDDQAAIYISLKGNVYDVTSAKDLYGPGQTYHCMAGREATRALAKLSFEGTDRRVSHIYVTGVGYFMVAFFLTSSSLLYPMLFLLPSQRVTLDPQIYRT